MFFSFYSHSLFLFLSRSNQCLIFTHNITANEGDTKIAGMSARRSQLHADQEAWEDNRMLVSGIAVVSEAQTDFDNEEDTR